MWTTRSQSSAQITGYGLAFECDGIASGVVAVETSGQFGVEILLPQGPAHALVPLTEARPLRGTRVDHQVYVGQQGLAIVPTGPLTVSPERTIFGEVRTGTDQRAPIEIWVVRDCCDLRPINTRCIPSFTD